MQKPRQSKGQRNDGEDSGHSALPLLEDDNANSIVIAYTGAVLGSFAIGAFGLLVFNFNANAQAQTGPTAKIRVVVSGPVAVRAGATCSHPEKELRPLR
jgi:hypothetical protein